MNEHVIVAYGTEAGYHHGAKYQILRAWDRIYSRPDRSVCVVTDKPDLFDGYPIRIVAISAEEKRDWSFNGLQHFGIKTQGFRKAIETGSANKFLLLDTDAYWRRDPQGLFNKLDKKNVVMFEDEGYVFGSRNSSIQRFEIGLRDRIIPLQGRHYRIRKNSKMMNSRIIGIEKSQISILERSFELFAKIEPLVDAHTVEQFTLGEICRIENITITLGKRYTGDWSSIGKKDYATPLLADFFAEYGMQPFEKQLKFVQEVKIERPLNVFLRQKTQRLFRKTR